MDMKIKLENFNHHARESLHKVVVEGCQGGRKRRKIFTKDNHQF